MNRTDFLDSEEEAVDLPSFCSAISSSSMIVDDVEDPESITDDVTNDKYSAWDSDKHLARLRIPRGNLLSFSLATSPPSDPISALLLFDESFAGITRNRLLGDWQS